jgi:hypothetical protein
MDSAGAEALKIRLEARTADEAPRPSAEIPDDALPVYRWLGIRPPEDAPAGQPA